MTSSLIRVPDGITMASALVAFWQGAPNATGKLQEVLPILEKNWWVDNKDEVIRRVDECFHFYFARRIEDLSSMGPYKAELWDSSLGIPHIFVHVFGGRSIQIDFTNWPVLEVSKFNAQFETKNAAERILLILMKEATYDRPDPLGEYKFCLPKSELLAHWPQKQDFSSVDLELFLKEKDEEKELVEKARKRDLRVNGF